MDFSDPESKDKNLVISPLQSSSSSEEYSTFVEELRGNDSSDNFLSRHVIDNLESGYLNYSSSNDRTSKTNPSEISNDTNFSRNSKYSEKSYKTFSPTILSKSSMSSNRPQQSSSLFFDNTIKNNPDSYKAKIAKIYSVKSNNYSLANDDTRNVPRFSGKAFPSIFDESCPLSLRLSAMSLSVEDELKTLTNSMESTSISPSNSAKIKIRPESAFSYLGRNYDHNSFARFTLSPIYENEELYLNHQHPRFVENKDQTRLSLSSDEISMPYPMNLTMRKIRPKTPTPTQNITEFGKLFPILCKSYEREKNSCTLNKKLNSSNETGKEEAGKESRMTSFEETTGAITTNESLRSFGKLSFNKSEVNKKTSTIILEELSSLVTTGLLNDIKIFNPNPTTASEITSDVAKEPKAKNLPIERLDEETIGVSSQEPTTLTPVIPRDVIMAFDVPIEATGTGLSIPMTATVWVPNDSINSSFGTLNQSSDEIEEPPKKFSRTDEYEDQSIDVSKNPSEQEVKEEPTVSDDRKIPIPRISIIPKPNSSPMRRSSRRTSSLRRPENVSRWLINAEYTEYDCFINDIIESLHFSEHLSRIFGSAFRRAYVWSQVHSDFAVYNKRTTWMLITKLITMELNERIYKFIGAWEERDKIFHTDTGCAWLAVPSYVRRIVKSKTSSLFWMLVSSSYNINSNSLNFYQFEATNSNSVGYEHAAWISPILNRRISAEIQAGRLDRRWIRLLKPGRLERFIVDYCKMRRSIAYRIVE